MKKLWPVIIPVIALLVLAACTSAETTTTTATTSPTTTTGTTTSPGGTTAGQLAASGQSVFASNCAGCHGADGQGVTAPAVIGPGQTLAGYGTALGLYNFIRTTMPAIAPGSLSSQQYLEVTAYLLVENDFVTGDAAMSSGNLGDISLP